MPRRALRVVKPEIRVLGVDDGKFVPHSRTQVPVVGIVFRGGYWFEGVMSTTITVDGFDSTEKICKMVINSPHYKQLRVILLNGITLGGFNVVDIKTLNRQTDLPVVAVTDKKPNMADVHAAVQTLSGSEERWAAVLSAGEIFSVSTKYGKRKIYVEIAGLSKEVAEQVLRLTSTRSKIPEPLRVAHLVASGINLNTT